MFGELRTDRLLLRRWQERDAQAFAAINADPAVMQFFPAVLSREASDTLIKRFESHFETHGFGVWAAELTAQNNGELIGCIGLNTVQFEAAFTPTVEILWRMAKPVQGQGLATEGARAVLRFAFEELALPEVVSFTVVENQASRRVMEKIGLQHEPALDFHHPALPPGHQLSAHVFYRLKNPRVEQS